MLNAITSKRYTLNQKMCEVISIANSILDQKIICEVLFSIFTKKNLFFKRSYLRDQIWIILNSSAQNLKYVS